MFIVADNAVNAPAVFARKTVYIPARIKRQQAGVAGKPEKVKAFVMKPVAGPVTRVIELDPVPVLGKQHQYVFLSHCSLSASCI